MIFTGPRLAHKNRLLPTELVETLRVTCTVWHRRHLDVGVYIILHLCAAQLRCDCEPVCRERSAR